MAQKGSFDKMMDSKTKIRIFALGTATVFFFAGLLIINCPADFRLFLTFLIAAVLALVAYLVAKYYLVKEVDLQAIEARLQKKYRANADENLRKIAALESDIRRFKAEVAAREEETAVKLREEIEQALFEDEALRLRLQKLALNAEVVNVNREANPWVSIKISFAKSVTFGWDELVESLYFSTKQLQADQRGRCSKEGAMGFEEIWDQDGIEFPPGKDEEKKKGPRFRPTQGEFIVTLELADPTSHIIYFYIQSKADQARLLCYPLPIR